MKEFISFSKELLRIYGVEDCLVDSHKEMDDVIDEIKSTPFINRRFKKEKIRENEIISVSGLDFTRALHYKNNVLHYYVIPAILVKACITMPNGNLANLKRFMSKMIKQINSIYFLPIKGHHMEVLDRVIQLFIDASIISLDSETYTLIPSAVKKNSIYEILKGLQDDIEGIQYEKDLVRMKRHIERINLNDAQALIVDDKGNSHNVFVKNFSQNGVYIETEIALSEDQYYGMIFDIGNEKLDFICSVARKGISGYGLRIVQNDSDSSSTFSNNHKTKIQVS